MGIPLYFNKITNHYKNIISPYKQKCNRLFLDFNGIIHNVYQDIKHNVDPNMNKDEFENILLKNVVDYTEIVCNYASPKELVYICIDGVAPLPKIQQQRKRRYLSSWLKSKCKEDGYLWDSNAISPGTDFMKKLNSYLRDYIKNKHSSYEIILSDSSHYGEGEHKIFDYIHYHPDSDNIDVIYGLDADLIMLSLTCDRSKKFLLREPQHYNRKASPTEAPFLWFNIDRLKDNLVSYYDNKIDLRSYVFLCFLIGNDFLPNLTYLGIHNDGITKIIDSYLKILDNFNEPLILQNDNDKYIINFVTLTYLFDDLTTNEDSEMIRLHKQYHDKSMIFKSNKMRLENYGISHKDIDSKHIFENKNWRFYYYTHLFDMNQYSDNTIDKVCKSYIDGLKWVSDYYFNKTNSSSWYYIYNYSPTLLDLYNFMEVNKNIVIHDYNEKTQFKISSDLQLLMILPIQSKDVLPIELQDIVNENSSVGYYYPNEFKIGSYLKTKLHECFPILPIFNINELQTVYLNTIS